MDLRDILKFVNFIYHEYNGNIMTFSIPVLKYSLWILSFLSKRDEMRYTGLPFTPLVGGHGLRVFQLSDLTLGPE